MLMFIDNANGKELLPIILWKSNIYALNALFATKINKQMCELACIIQTYSVILSKLPLLSCSEGNKFETKTSQLGIKRK